MFWRHKPKGTKQMVPPVSRCSFCNKTQHDVYKLIAGPRVFICGECVKVCNNIIADDARFKRPIEDSTDSTPLPWPADASDISCALCQTRIDVSGGVTIEKRGIICTDCLDAVEEAAIRQRQKR